MQTPTLVVTLALAIVLAGCEGQSSLPAGPEVAHQSSHLVAPRSRELNQSLSELARATARFHNFRAAEAAEYDTPLTVCWYHSELGAMGYHYGNPSLIDGEVSLLEPETLVYEPGRNGTLKLVAVEYLVPTDAWEGETPPSLFGQEFHDTGAGLYVLHAWLWRHNPNGMFADWNPAVSCDHAEESEDRA